MSSDYGTVESLDRLADQLQDEEYLEREHWKLFDVLLARLDDEPSVAQRARHLLETVICERGLTRKEELLKAGEALSWYARGPGGVEFLLRRLHLSLGSLEKRRARAQGAELMHCIRNNLALDVAEAWDASLVLPALTDVCNLMHSLQAVDADALADVLLAFVEMHRISPDHCVSVAESMASWLPALDESDGRSVYILNVVTTHMGVAQNFLRCCVFSPAETLARASPIIITALKQFAEDYESDHVMHRAVEAMALVRRLVMCIPPNTLSAFQMHSWSLRLLQAIIDFCVRCPRQEERTAAWAVVENVLSKMQAAARAECLASLLESPFGTVASLLCTRVKSEIVGATTDEERAFWWRACVDSLFPRIFIVPAEDSELNARRDAVLAAVNLLLFLTIRRRTMSVEDAAIVTRLHDDYLAPLEKRLQVRISQAHLPKDVDAHNQMLSKMDPSIVGATSSSSGQTCWTQESLEQATQKMLVADELLYSAVDRVRALARGD